MGQKVSPHGLRVGINKGWSSVWYADKADFAKNLLEDSKIREALKSKYYNANISSIEIERTDSKLIVNINTGRPGMLIGQKGAGIEEIKKVLAKVTDCKNIILNIKEVKRVDLDAQLIAEGIAMQLEKRVAFKRAIKDVMPRVMKAGAEGVKITVGGRLNGAEIARSESFHLGSLPLQTLRADIDYGTASAHTTYGVVGVKVWVYKGNILGKKNKTQKTTEMGGNE